MLTIRPVRYKNGRGRGAFPRPARIRPEHVEIAARPMGGARSKGEPVESELWDPATAGVMALPSGRLVRGRGLRNGDAVAPLRVEFACLGGRGRTGTALACLAIVDGVSQADGSRPDAARTRAEAVNSAATSFADRRAAHLQGSSRAPSEFASHPARREIANRQCRLSCLEG